MKKKSSVATRPAKTASPRALAVKEARERVKAAKQHVRAVKAQLKLARAAVKAAKSARKRAEGLARAEKRPKPAPPRKVVRAKVPAKRAKPKAPKAVARPTVARVVEPKLLPVPPVAPASDHDET